MSGATATAEGMSSMCMQAQHLLAGLAVEDDARLQVTDAFHASLADLGHCSPSCSSATGGIVSASTCSHVDCCERVWVPGGELGKCSGGHADDPNSVAEAREAFRGHGDSNEDNVCLQAAPMPYTHVSSKRRDRE